MIRVRTEQINTLFVNEQTIRELFGAIQNAPNGAGEITVTSEYCPVIVKINLGESESIGYRTTDVLYNNDPTGDGLICGAESE